MKITSVPVGALLLSAVLALTGVGSAHVLAQPTAPNTKQSQQQAQALKGPLLPAGGIAHRDIAYVNNGHERQKLDLYLPENKTGEKLPVIIWVHGGSWSKGSKIGGIPLTRGFNARGYAIACVGYRLTDTAPFPAQIEDCKAAVRWLRANAVKYNLDTTRFAAWGSSAGGHLVAMLGTTGGIRTFDIGANPDVSSAVQAVIDYFGPTDFSDPVLKGADYVGGNSRLGKFLGGVPAKKRALALTASPVTHITKTAAPTFILHGTKDKTVPISQSERLYVALKKADAIVKIKTIENAGHEGQEFRTPETLAEVDAFLREQLKIPANANL